MNTFIEKIADILEIPASELNETSKFRDDMYDWDSMRGFAVLCMLEDDYDLKLSVDDFMKCDTIGELFAKTNG